MLHQSNCCSLCTFFLQSVARVCSSQAPSDDVVREVGNHLNRVQTSFRRLDHELLVQQDNGLEAGTDASGEVTQDALIETIIPLSLPWESPSLRRRRGEQAGVMAFQLRETRARSIVAVMEPQWVAPVIRAWSSVSRHDAVQWANPSPSRFQANTVGAVAGTCAVLGIALGWNRIPRRAVALGTTASFGMGTLALATHVRWREELARWDRAVTRWEDRARHAAVREEPSTRRRTHASFPREVPRILPLDSDRRT